MAHARDYQTYGRVTLGQAIADMATLAFLVALGALVVWIA